MKSSLKGLYFGANDGSETLKDYPSFFKRVVPHEDLYSKRISKAKFDTNSQSSARVEDVHVYIS
jgi:hypothetical protein